MKIFFLLLLLFSFNLFAEKIEFNKLYVHQDTYDFILSSEDLIYTDALIIKDNDREYKYNLDRHLVFCEGEEDGCSDTGVFIKKFDFYPNDLIFISALVGAHSKILYIFDPQKHTTQYIKKYTGAYYVKYMPKRDYIEVSYDSYCDKEEPCKVTEKLFSLSN